MLFGAIYGTVPGYFSKTSICLAQDITFFECVRTGPADAFHPERVVASGAEEVFRATVGAINVNVPNDFVFVHEGIHHPLVFGVAAAVFRAREDIVTDPDFIDRFESFFGMCP